MTAKEELKVGTRSVRSEVGYNLSAQLCKDSYQLSRYVAIILSLALISKSYFDDS